jgi:hypothetical protein
MQARRPLPGRQGNEFDLVMWQQHPEQAPSLAFATRSPPATAVSGGRRSHRSWAADLAEQQPLSTGCCRI